MGSRTERKKSSSYQGYDKYVSDHARDISGRARALGQQGYQPYQGQINAGINQAHMNAQGQAGQAPVTYDPASRSSLAGQIFDPRQSQGFIDQYLQASSPALADIENQYNANVNELNSQAGSAFGGVRAQIAAGMADRNRLRARGDVMSNAINRGIATGYQAHQANIGNQQQAEGLLQNAARTQQGIRSAGIADSLNVGNTIHGIQQGDLNRNYNVHNYNQMAPYQQMAMEQGILAGLPLNRHGTTTTRTTKPSNLGQTILKGGLALGAAAIGGPMGGAIAGSMFGGGGDLAGQYGVPRPRPI